MTATTVAAPRGHRTSSLTLGAGVLFAVVPPLVELVSDDAFVLMGLALLLLMTSVPGLHRLQNGRDGAWGWWGARLTIVGVLGLVGTVVGAEVIPSEAVWLALAGSSALATLGGVVAFSWGMTRARVLAAGGIWTFLGAMTLGLAAESFEQSLRGPVPWLADVLPVAGFVTAGVGLVLVGLSARRVEDGARG